MADRFMLTISPKMRAFLEYETERTGRMSIAETMRQLILSSAEFSAFHKAQAETAAHQDASHKAMITTIDKLLDKPAAKPVGRPAIVKPQRRADLIGNSHVEWRISEWSHMHEAMRSDYLVMLRRAEAEADAEIAAGMVPTTVVADQPAECPHGAPIGKSCNYCALMNGERVEGISDESEAAP